nr:MAG TPA: hypothetical protein [Caudoviricetes sp.]
MGGCLIGSLRVTFNKICRNSIRYFIFELNLQK